MKAISLAQLADWRLAFGENPLHQVIANAIIKNGVQAVAQQRTRITELNYAFSHEVPTPAITHQRQSGRCWIFAGLNVIRQNVAEKLGVKEFELSQAYLMFYDKLEKANYFLESILKTVDEPLEGRLLSWLLAAPLQDGGQWDMFVSLVDKYGVVPKDVMPESFHSSNSRHMNQLVTAKLREDAATLRQLAKSENNREALSHRKSKMVADIYRMLAHFLGEPPQTFDFEYRDDNHAYHADRGIRPKEFFDKYATIALNDYVSIINAPTADKPFGRSYTVDYLGNVTGGQGVLYLNLPGERFQQIASQQLEEGAPVWFGCDVGKMSERDTGILDVDQFDYDAALGVTLHMTKGERLAYGESQMTHAMVLIGVNLVDGHPNRWKVENSWGPDVGRQGFFIMSDAWFHEYVYQIVAHKKYLSDAERAALDAPPVVLPPWDPMGSLA